MLLSTFKHSLESFLLFGIQLTIVINICLAAQHLNQLVVLRQLYRFRCRSGSRSRSRCWLGNRGGSRNSYDRFQQVVAMILILLLQVLVQQRGREQLQEQGQRELLPSSCSTSYTPPSWFYLSLQSE